MNNFKDYSFRFWLCGCEIWSQFFSLKFLSGCILYLEQSNTIKKKLSKNPVSCSFRACENFIVLLNRQKLLDVNELILRGSGGPLFIFGWFFFGCSFTVYFAVLPCNPVINFLKQFSWLGLNYHSMEREGETLHCFVFNQ